MAKNKSHNNTKREKAPSFLEIIKYCLPHMGIMALIPIACVILTLILRAFGLSTIAEFATSYIAFPQFILMPLGITVKVINTLKLSFPRNSYSHRVFLSVLGCSAISTIAIELLFIIGCSLYGFFPLEFRGAAYMRDMYTSSPAAMNIFYMTLFMFYTFITMLILASHFISDRLVKKGKFTLSCLVFIAFYIFFLIFFLLSYFGATFLNIITLERIQINSSIFNSSMLCAFLVFDILSLLFSPALYFITMRFLNKKPK